MLLLLAAKPAWAIDPGRHLTQYAHTAWRVQDGVFTGAIATIAQTASGYVWIGTVNGLVQFDGVRFVAWKSAKGQSLPRLRITALLGTRDGSLWIGTSGGLSQLKDGDLFNFPQTSGIAKIIEDQSGTIWVTRYAQTDGGGPLCKVDGQMLQCFDKTDGIPVEYGVGLGIDSLGNFWIGSHALCQWKPGEVARTYFQKELSHTEAGVLELAAGPNGSMWAALEGTGRDLGVRHFVRGAWTSYEAGDFHGTLVHAQALFLDRENALWVGTLNDGLYRIHDGVAEHYRSADGLSSNAVNRIYEDREGNIWVATDEGLDVFRDLPMATFGVREGLSAGNVGSVLAARDGSTWVANQGALDVIRGSKVSSIRINHGPPGQMIRALLEDQSGRIWAGVDVQLAIYEHGKFSQIGRADINLLNDPGAGVSAMTVDVEQNIWVLDFGLRRRKLFRLEGRTIREEVPLTGLSNPVHLAPDRKDGIWIGGQNQIARYRKGQFETWALAPGNDSLRVRDLLVDAEDSVWVATGGGLFGWKNGTLKALTTGNGLPCDAIFSLLEDNRDSLWLYTQCGLVRVAKAELSKWWEQPASQVAVRVFDALDGVRPSNISADPRASKSPDGRLWFGSEGAVQVVDPDHLYENTLPPPVHIEGVVADRKDYPLGGELRLPALTRDLQIDYTALSFVVPQRVRFRYKLEGRDVEWQDVGNRRLALYSDLRPGTYRFQVIACNNDGVWNDVGATLIFSIAPAWYQTGWFRLLCVVSALFIVWTVYRLRLRQVARAMSVRFDERLAERTRIARELHDTLLQTVQGSKFVADDALDTADDSARMRRSMEKLAGWLGQATQEGRAALNSLRTSTIETNDLAAGLRRATEECLPDKSMAVKFSVAGGPRDMHPIARDEIYRIGYEAIRNACEHASASELTVSLNYAQDLTLRVIDNGVGVEPAVLAGGKEGHFGLRGMRERAERIGSKLTLNSSPHSGTEMTLVVPGSVIFRKARTTRFERIKTFLGGRDGDSDRD